MYYVYILRSISHPEQRYVGLTENVERRLQEHNQGKSSHTKKYLPWRVETVIGFTEKNKATTFEKYLKTGSGHAFAYKHF